MNPTPYAERDWPARLEVMQACEAAGSLFRDRTPSGFVVAIGRTRYGATVETLAALGFACVRMYTFPLGSDKPADHLRHDSHGVPSSCWLLAEFQTREATA